MRFCQELIIFQVQRLAVNKRGRNPCPHDLYRIKQSQSFRFIKRRNVYKTTVSSFKIVVVQLLSRVQLFATPWTAAHQASLSITISRSLCKLMSTELVIPSNHLIFCSTILLLSSVFSSIGSFQMSQFFTSGGQSIGVSASTLEFQLPMNIQDWFPLGWTSWISLQSKGLSRVFSNITVQKQFFGAQLSL